MTSNDYEKLMLALLLMAILLLMAMMFYKAGFDGLFCFLLGLFSSYMLKFIKK